MKLSIWIFENWLQEFNPIMSVQEGEPTIEGVRLFSHNSYPDNRFIYVGSNYQFFSNKNSEEILLIHRNDVISLGAYNIEDVLNKTIQAFEYFSQWENEMRIASQSKNPLQKIIDCCSQVLGPMFLMDSRLNLLAFSKNYHLGEVNSLWDVFLQLNSSTIEQVAEMKNSNFVKQMNTKHSFHLFEEVMATPYTYGLIDSYCDDEGKIIAQFTVASKEPITLYEIHLVKMIKEIFNTIKEKPHSSSEVDISQSILLNILQNKEISEENIKKLLILQDWCDSDRFCFISAKIEKNTDPESLQSIQERTLLYIENSISIVYDGRLVYLVKINEQTNPLSQAASKLVHIFSLSIGVSFEFNGLSDLYYYYKQSIDVLNIASNLTPNINYFKDYALDVLIDADCDYAVRCCHPIVKFLELHDKLHDTSLSRTLNVFLKNERNYLFTAQELFLHRNSIKYRINQILNLFPIDLENPKEREYIIYSFRRLKRG